MQKQVTVLRKMTIEDKSLLMASYLMANQIAKYKKPYTVGELKKPCMLKACEQILGMLAAQKLKLIPTSANTIKRRIEDMTDGIENQIIKKVKIHQFIQYN
ncbi:uncharacterized protein TNCV_1293311 [Trichonephila clavipes]|nr:uncharacterized protein TNCV_1293311 [Trichonephila clavipes]